MRIALFAIALHVLLAMGLCCQADVPRIVYNGDAVNSIGQKLADGVHSATFRVYADAKDAAPVWSETIKNVKVVNGRFHVELGRTTPLSLEWSRPYFVSVQFDSRVENTRRTQLYQPSNRVSTAAISNDQAYLAADGPLYEPAQSGIVITALPGGNYGANIGSYEGVISYSNGADTGGWSSLEPYGQDGYQWQCVEYPRRFYRLHLGMDTSNWYANGCDFYGLGPSWGLEQHPNNGTALPQPDDILCFNMGTYGHVAVVISASSSGVNIIQQNWSATTGYYTFSRTNGIIYGSTCQGWLHKPGNGTDTTAPVITNVRAAGTTTTGATIAWSTDDASTSLVQYGLTSTYGQSTSEDTNYVISHSVGLSGLTADTLYHYRVKSTNSASLTTYSGDYTFTATNSGTVQEQLTNGGFETCNTSGWTAYSRTAMPTLSTQTTGVSCGTCYLYEQMAANGAGGVRQTVTGLTNGATYTISGARKSVHTDAVVSVKVDTDGGTDYASAEQTIASDITSGWSTFSANVTATGTSMTVFLDTSVVGAAHVGAFDCISLMGVTGECATSSPGQPTVAQDTTTTLKVTNNAGDPGSFYYAFRINDGSACSNKFVQSDGSFGASPVWQTKGSWGTKTITGLTSGTSYTLDAAEASDASGTCATSDRYEGVYVNNPTLGTANKWGSGDTAATFDGSTDYVTLPTMDADVNLSTGFTIECWANPSALNTWYPVIQLTDSANYGTFVNHICFDMSGTGGTMRGEVYQSGGCGSPCLGNYYTSPSLSFTAGAWHHYAMVVTSGGTLTFYKDGVADAGQALLYMPSSGVTRGKVQIGRRDTTTSNYWHGSLDEVAIYSSALSGARIGAHYNAADAALYNTAVIQDNPVAYWRLGESTGTAAADNKGGYGPSATQTTTSCSAPAAPTDGSPTATSATGITWAWADVSGETGYRVKDTGGVSKSGDLAANAIQWAEGSLTPNTSYTRKIYAFNACGESAGSTGQTKYTLAKAGESTDGTGATGNVYCTSASKSTWYAGNKAFVFSNPAGFGAGGAWKASSFQYKWNQTATETWSTAGTSWTSGTISLTATSGDGDYYLHVRALNGNSAANNSDVVNYGPFKSDATAPSTVTVTDEGTYTPSQNTLKASWTASTDAGSGLKRYEYAVGTSSTTQNIKGWTSAGTSTTVAATGLTLTDGTKYWVQARAIDNVDNPATGAAANGITVAPGVNPIANAWPKANTTDPLSLRNKVVTAAMSGAFWLEETNQAMGIKVVSSASVTRGNSVSVAGVLGLSGTQRALIGDVVINSGGSATIQPLAMNGQSLGGASFNSITPGITGGIGLYNIGLLVKAFGNVTYSNTANPSDKYFYLDDGSGLLRDGHAGVLIRCGSVAPPTTGIAIVTGIVTSELSGSNVVPVIIIRDSADILTP